MVFILKTQLFFYVQLPGSWQVVWILGFSVISFVPAPLVTRRNVHVSGRNTTSTARWEEPKICNVAIKSLLCRVRKRYTTRACTGRTERAPGLSFSFLWKTQHASVGLPFYRILEGKQQCYINALHPAAASRYRVEGVTHTPKNIPQHRIWPYALPIILQQSICHLPYMLLTAE